MSYQNYAQSKIVKLLPAKPVQYSVDGDIPVSDIAPITTFASDSGNNGGMVLARPILIYGESKNPPTPREFITRVNNKLADSFANCYISESRYLSIFQDALSQLLLVNGDRRFNNFIAEYTIALEYGQEEYELPDNIDKPINLWSEKDTDWYKIQKRFDFVPRMSWSNNNQIYTYTLQSNRILIKLPEEDNRDKCCHCKQCPSCKLVHGTLRFEYYYLPDLPTLLDEPIWWFWRHPAAYQYLEELIEENVYKVNKQVYRSEYKDIYRDKLLEYDNNLNPIDPTPKIKKQIFKFSKF